MKSRVRCGTLVYFCAAAVAAVAFVQSCRAFSSAPFNSLSATACKRGIKKQWMEGNGRIEDPSEISQGLEKTPFEETGSNKEDISGGEEVVTKDLSVRRIIDFAIPAVGIWVCSPLLSVIDTSAVGLISGTVQQAALNPAVAVTDYSARLMSFLYTGTTNLIAIAYTRDSKLSGDDSSKDTLVGALRLSVRVGLGLCAMLLVSGDPMLRGLIGGSDAAGDLMLASRKYVWIRSLGMPAAAMIGTAQAACLGMQDTKSPLLVTLLAASVNLVADIVLVRHGNEWIGGVAGAAWATILSQYVAVACYLRWLSDGTHSGNNNLQRIKTKSGKFWLFQGRGRHTNPGSKSSSVRGILKDRLKFRDLFLKRPGESSAASDFAPYVIPVTTTQVGRCSVYVAMGIVVSGLNVVTMAANQILNAFFYALIPIADSLGQTAQALLPPLFEDSRGGTKTNSVENTDRLFVALKSFLKAGIYCGGCLATVVATIPLLTKIFMTTDPTVQSLVNSVVPIHMLIFLFHGIFCASEGILLAQNDLGYLGKMYGLYFVVVPALMLQLKRFGSDLKLQTVWHLFMAYQLFRIIAWAGRVWWLFHQQRQGDVIASVDV